MPLPSHYAFHLFWRGCLQLSLWSMMLFMRTIFSQWIQTGKKIVEKTKIHTDSFKICLGHVSPSSVTPQVQSVQKTDVCIVCGSRLA